ncbi:hypothetical protein HK101_011891 [Irineochytrium annulatum]|nr:hypothetical protein HK101_011891 [Irineochytrium annulatum]
MNREDLPNDLRRVLTELITTDQAQIQATIDAYYDDDCKLQNPYMILNGKEEILRSYYALSSSNMDLRSTIDTITYDAASQTAMVDMIQFSSPKALGGLVPIKIHQVLKLQLESAVSNPNLLVIANHHEIHVTQDYIAQLPIVGGFYDTTLRGALGQLTLAGSAVLNYTGLMDAVPKGVSLVKGAVGATRAKVGEVYRGTMALTGAVAHATGVDRVIDASFAAVGGIRSTVNWAVEGGRDAAASLIEEGKGVVVDCYSPTCKAGVTCYSPTCPRGRTLTVGLTMENVGSIVKGMYLEGGKRTGLFKAH